MQSEGNGTNIRIKNTMYGVLKEMAVARGMALTSLISGILYEWIEMEQKKEATKKKAVEKASTIKEG